MRIGPLILTVRRASEALQETPNLHQRVQRLEIALAELEQAHVTLSGHHLKLRNQFHGEKGGRPPGARRGSQNEELPLAEIPFGDKAALRRRLGVVPGQRYNHEE